MGEMLRDVVLRTYCPMRGGVVRRIRRRMFYPNSHLIGDVKDKRGRSPNTQHPTAMAMLVTPIKYLG